jgi:hypothetical protein
VFLYGNAQKIQRFTNERIQFGSCKEALSSGSRVYFLNRSSKRQAGGFAFNALFVEIDL